MTLSSEFRSSVFNHFNTVISTFSDWFRRTVMRPRGWRFGFPHYPTITLGQALCLIEWGWLVLYFMGIDWLSIMQRISCLFCYIKYDLTYFTYFLDSFCNWYFLRSWNQTGFVRSQCIPSAVNPMFFTVLAVSINHVYQESTVLRKGV